MNGYETTRLRYLSPNGRRNFIGAGSISDAELSNGIRSFEKQIALHERWIADPTTKTPDFGKFDPRRQASLMERWKKDISRHRECIEIQRKILKERANG